MKKRKLTYFKIKLRGGKVCLIAHDRIQHFGMLDKGRVEVITRGGQRIRGAML